MKVHIFIPCFIDQLYPQVGISMVKVLEKLGCEVHYNAQQTCCGQPAFNAGFRGEAKEVCAKFVDDFFTADVIVAPSASCVGYVKNYMQELFTDAKLKAKCSRIGQKIYEFSYFLVHILKQTQVGASFPYKVTYHDSCAALRECNIAQEPRTLLSQVKGLELVELKDNTACCGFGGTFAVKFSEISAAMADQKIDHALDTEATYLVSTDMSCLMHIDGCARFSKKNIQVIHIADVLASGW